MVSVLLATSTHPVVAVASARLVATTWQVAAAAGEAEAQVLLDRQLAEDATPLGHERDAATSYVLGPAADE